MPDGNIIPKSILENDKIALLSSIQESELVNGLIAYKTDGVIDISNFFGSEFVDFQLMMPMPLRAWQVLGRHCFVSYELSE